MAMTIRVLQNSIFTVHAFTGACQWQDAAWFLLRFDLGRASSASVSQPFWVSLTR